MLCPSKKYFILLISKPILQKKKKNGTQVVSLHRLLPLQLSLQGLPRFTQHRFPSSFFRSNSRSQNINIFTHFLHPTHTHKRFQNCYTHATQVLQYIDRERLRTCTQTSPAHVAGRRGNDVSTGPGRVTILQERGSDLAGE